MWLVVLLVIFVGSVVWLVWHWPLGPVLTVALVVVAGAAAALISAYYIPDKLDKRLKRALTVGVGFIALIAAVLAIPALQRPQDEPLTASLGFGVGCEKFAVPSGLLPSVPTDAELDAKWVYNHDGATSGSVLSLTVQGKTQDAVILNGLRVVDLKAQDPPSNVADILPCGHVYQEVVPVRYFEVDLSDPLQIRSSPAPDPDPYTGKSSRQQPSLTKFPTPTRRYLYLSPPDRHAFVIGDWHSTGPVAGAPERPSLITASGKSGLTRAPIRSARNTRDKRMERGIHRCRSSQPGAPSTQPHLGGGRVDRQGWQRRASTRSVTTSDRSALVAVSTPGPRPAPPSGRRSSGPGTRP